MPSYATPDSSTLEDKRYAAVHSPVLSLNCCLTNKSGNFYVIH